MQNLNIQTSNPKIRPDLRKNIHNSYESLKNNVFSILIYMPEVVFKKRQLFFKKSIKIENEHFAPELP